MLRSTTALLLVLAATLVAPLVIATSWLTTRVDDRAAYVETVTPLAEDAAVRRHLADAAADAAVTALQQRVPVGLPDVVDVLAQRAATEVVESPDFPAFWRKANADLHRDVMRLVENPAARADGWVTVDASPLLGQVLLILAERGLPVDLLPEIRLDVRVVPEAQLVEVSDRYRAARAAQQWLPVIWAGLVLLALIVAPGWRGRLRTAGLALLGVAAAAVLVLLAVDPVVTLAQEQAAAGREELTRLMLEGVLQSLTPYARGFLLGAPIGLVLLALTLWPRRRERAELA